ncbi:MAG: LysM peptidoglycan-binding domain-containing protein [Anaerolineae bacterium]
MSVRWAVIGVVLLLTVAGDAVSAESGFPPARGPQTADRIEGPAAALTSADQTGPIIHVVKRGETLFLIAQRYGVDVWQIAVYNSITNPHRIFAGQVLRIPRLVHPAPTPLPCPCEEIVIITPGRGVTITNPVTVSGEAISPFEQTVVVTVLDGSGMQIGLEPGVIEGKPGERGPYTVSVPFAVPFNSQQGRIQVFTESPRDGAMEHLSSVTVNIQGLDLDALLERLETAITSKDLTQLQSLVAPKFQFGLYRSAWLEMPAALALEMLYDKYMAPGNPRLDFSVDARALLSDRAAIQTDVIHVVLSPGWGAARNDDAFLVFGAVEGRARWTGLLYVMHDLIDYR